MPTRKKRSKAVLQREEKKRRESDDLCENANEHKQNSDLFTYATHSVTTELDYRVVSGTFNQGDSPSMYPGIQCTYLSLFALIYVQQKHPSTWSPIDINSCIIRGDKHFHDSSSERNETPHMLLVNELPKILCVYDEVYKCHHYDDEINVGLIAEEIPCEYKLQCNFKLHSRRSSKLFWCFKFWFIRMRRSNSLYLERRKRVLHV